MRRQRSSRGRLGEGGRERGGHGEDAADQGVWGVRGDGAHQAPDLEEALLESGQQAGVLLQRHLPAHQQDESPLQLGFGQLRPRGRHGGGREGVSRRLRFALVDHPFGLSAALSSARRLPR